MSMWSSRCLINWLPWSFTTRRFCTVCCFAPVPRPCWRLLPIPNILVLTSAFLVCSTPGDRIFSRTLTHDAGHYHLLHFQRTEETGFPHSPLVASACLSGVA